MTLAAAPPPEPPTAIAFDAASGHLTAGGRTTQLHPRAAAVLACLMEAPGRVVTREALLERVWPGLVVTDNSVFQCINEIRRALGERHAGLVRTLPRRGYSYVGGAVSAGAHAARPAAPPAPPGEVSWCTAPDGVRLAVVRHGSGPPVIRAGNYLAQAGVPADDPLVRPFVDALGPPGRSYAAFDMRGCGLSQRDLGEANTFEHWVADLDAVIDHLGEPQVTLFGIAQGAAIAVAYAARFPQRVRRLLLLGGYARHRFNGDDPALRAQAEARIELMRVGWSLPQAEFRLFFVSELAPDAPLALQQHIADRLRASIDGPTAVRHVRSAHAIDVRAEAAQVRCPTLVTHFESDRNVPVALGSGLAALIAGARFVCLPGHNHVPFEAGEPWRRFTALARSFLDDGGR